MVGLVIATHGHLAQEMVSTAEQIVGKLTAVAACSIAPSASPESIREEMKRAVASVETGQGVIILADLVGGTPCNQSLMLCDKTDLEVLTGVNLPMLLKAQSLRDLAMPLPEMAAALAAYGQKNIVCASERLRDANASRHH